MRQLTLALAAIATVACAKQESPSADSPAAAQAAAPPAPAPLTAAAVAGTWEAVGMPMDKDTVIVRMTMTMDSTGKNSKTVFSSGESFTNTSTVYDGDSVVSMAGPFKSQLRKGQMVTTRVVLRMQDGKLVGVTHAKYANGDTADIRISATRKQ